jgi:hypothetical protein
MNEERDRDENREEDAGPAGEPGESEAETQPQANAQPAGEPAAAGAANREEPQEVSKDARLRVLRLVAEGRLTVDEAEELLAALDADAAEDREERRDVFVHAGPGPFPAQAPMPPMPPMPPMAPLPPMPPRWAPGAGPSDVMYRRMGRAARELRRAMPAVVAAPPGGQQIFHASVRDPRGGPPPHATLIVRTQEGECETRTRIPLSAAAVADQFLPKQARQHLATCEIDIKAIASHVAEMAGRPDVGDEPLLQIQEGETEVRISLE